MDNAGEAEDAIATLATGCRTFELELNADKTTTLHASVRISNTCSAELQALRVSTARGLQHYFIKAFQFAHDFPNDNVLDFAVKRTRGFRVQEQHWAIYESFLLKAARANATVIPAVVQILVSYNYYGYDLGRDRVGKLIEDLISKNAPLAHHAEVVWALFLAKDLRIRISRKATRAVSGLENAICALLYVRSSRTRFGTGPIGHWIVGNVYDGSGSIVPHMVAGVRSRFERVAQRKPY